MKWCEHIHWGKNIVRQEGWCLGSDMIVDHQDWKFCPMCGARRPKEKELWEKFWEWLQSHRYDTDVAGKELAKIAEEHFKKV